MLETEAPGSAETFVSPFSGFSFFLSFFFFFNFLSLEKIPLHRGPGSHIPLLNHDHFQYRREEALFSQIHLEKV